MNKTWVTSDQLGNYLVPIYYYFGVHCIESLVVQLIKKIRLLS